MQTKFLSYCAFKENPGFDCVIGNPPYVRQESIKELKPYLQENYEEIYSGYADLAIYFVQRSLDLLKENGYHSFIITNKWLRANYGTKLRGYLPEIVKIKSLVDLNGTKVFPDAGVDVLIYSFCKNKVSRINSGVHEFDYCLYGEKTAEAINKKVYDKFFKVDQSNLSQSWILETKEIIKVKEHIEKVGTKINLIDDIEIYRGITTGLNDAFIIDKPTRDRLISEDPKSEDLIEPILRGRDIKRWKIEFAGQYLLFIKWNTEIENYPAVKRDLDNFRDRLEKRPEARSGRYNWYCLARYGSNYYREFEKPKIVWQRVTNSFKFILDTDKLYILDSMAFMISNKVSVTSIIVQLNSSLIYFYFDKICHQYSDSGYLLSNQYVEEIPIIELAENEQQVYSKIAEILIELHKADFPDAEMIEYFDRTIADNLVYELYFFDDRRLRDLVAKWINDTSEDKRDACPTSPTLYRGLVGDNAIADRVKEIQNHKFVKVIENKEG